MSRLLRFLPMLLLLVTTVVPVDAGTTPHPVEARIERAIRDRLLTGALLVVGNRGGIVRVSAIGRTLEGEPITANTLFDLASLTKVIATTPAIMKLLEEGRLSLVDPLSRHIPELGGTEAGDLLLWNLLTHTSGLDDISLSASSPMSSLISRVASTPVAASAGRRFRYADVNFILLAEIVFRVTGTRMDRYLERSLFSPLGMRHSSFFPSAGDIPGIAATITDGATLMRGVVQDRNARSLGGVAGHAGLFSSGEDLARFCRMILGGGELDGVRVLEQRTVEQMISPYFSRGGEVARGLGWDIASPFSSPRGIGLSPRSFGHTGYSGTSVWIDPDNDLFVIFLASRIDYRNRLAFSTLRADVSTLAVEEILLMREIERELSAEGDLSDHSGVSIP